MNRAATAPPAQLKSLYQFVRTPKGSLIAILGVIGVVALAVTGPGLALPNVVAACLVCCALDASITYLKTDELLFPDGAFLTGLIIAFVLRPQEPLRVVVATSVLAIASKHALRTRWSNVFNPAALGLVIAAVLFQSGESWWGALPGLGPAGVLLLIAAGAFMADRINKLPLVLAFLAGYFVLFAEASFLVSDTASLAEIFRSPDLQAALFFAFFMLDDPPTCPVRYSHQVAFGLIAAFVSYVVFLAWGPVYFLLAGLLVANGLESVRRVYLRRLPLFSASG